MNGLKQQDVEVNGKELQRRFGSLNCSESTSNRSRAASCESRTDRIPSRRLRTVPRFATDPLPTTNFRFMQTSEKCSWQQQNHSRQRTQPSGSFEVNDPDPSFPVCQDRPARIQKT